MLSTIQGKLAVVVHRTIDCMYWLDLGSETELCIWVEELLLHDAYLSMVMDYKQSWFTHIEVLDPTYHQFFFTTNSLGCQPTSFQYFQSLAVQTLSLAASATHCACSDCSSGQKASVMFSQDEY